jgi:hypothetical protein
VLWTPPDGTRNVSDLPATCIEKDDGYVHVMKSFIRTFVPCTQNLFTHTSFRPCSVRT